MPEGNTSEQVHEFYNYLYSQYMQSIPVDRTQILWSGPFWVALFAVILTVFFFLVAVHFTRVHRTHDELYGASSFAGSLMERVGPVSFFTISVISMTVLWGVYYIVAHIVMGQIY